jgi:cytochrome P450
MEFENATTGAMEKHDIKYLMFEGFNTMQTRFFSLLHLLFPRFYHWDVLPSQRCEARNWARYERLIQRIIDEKRANLATAEEKSDMISILLEMKVFDDQEIIAQVTTMFFAGMKTIQTSTTNLI